MNVSELMKKHNLTGDVAAFLAAVHEYQADRHRPTPSEVVLIQQVAGDLGDLLDQGVALGVLRGGGTRSLHALAQKIRHQAAAARREVARRKMNQRRHVVTVGG